MLIIQRLLLNLLILVLPSPLDAHRQYGDPRDDAKLHCPPPAQIHPCICDLIFSSTSLNLTCHGYTVIQLSVTNLFIAVRQSNYAHGICENPPNPSLNSINFYLIRSNLEALHLFPFAQCKFSYFSLIHNSRLEALVAPTDPEESDQSKVAPFLFRANVVQVTHSQVKDESIHVLLKLLQHESVGLLDVTGNRITGINDGRSGDFFEGLASQTILRYLYLNENEIETVEGGQFKRLGQLGSLQLKRNKISRLGQDAFYFHEPDPDTALEISLQGNLLDDLGVEIQNGLELSTRQTYLDLRDNHFNFISMDKFKPFLDNNQKNEMSLGGNKLFCDRRMQWLIDQKESYMRRVSQVDCQNFNGISVFSANLTLSSNAGLLQSQFNRNFIGMGVPIVILICSFNSNLNL